jgi:diguanylate cyclase
MAWISVTRWRHVFIYSALITALSVFVPVMVVSVSLWQLPWAFKAPILTISAAIPLFIAFPISVFSLNLLRTMNGVMAVMDGLVRYDGLTGLLNRTHFLHLVQEQRRNTGLFAIVDADHFKRINDTYGHDCGDEALKYLSQNLSQVFGPYGLVARQGGEEFSVYLPHVSLEQMRLLVAMLRTALVSAPLTYEGTELHITVSIGVASDRLDTPMATISKKADNCLYAAKHAGRNRCFFANAGNELVQLAA